MTFITEHMLTDLKQWNPEMGQCVALLQREHTQLQSQIELRDLQVRILEDQLRKLNQLHFGRSSERYDERGQQCIETLFADDDTLPLHHAVHLNQILEAHHADDLAALMQAQSANTPMHEHTDDCDLQATQDLDSKINMHGGSPLEANAYHHAGERKRGGGRLVLPDALERVVNEITLPLSETQDVNGNPLPIVGYKSSESLAYRQASYYVEVEKRAIYGKPFDDETPRIVTPSRRLYAKSQIANSMAAHCIASKFQYHIPMYRLEQQLTHQGLGQIDRQRLSRTLIHIALLPAVQAVYQAIKTETLASPVVGLDDTTCPMLEPGNDQCRITRMWALTSGKNAWYHHALTRSGKECLAILKDYHGIIQCDDYGGHNILFKTNRDSVNEDDGKTPNRERMGCLAHLRRYFHDALPNKHGHVVVRLIKKIYQIHDIINEQFDNLPPTTTEAALESMNQTIIAQRQQYIRPLFDELFDHLDLLLQSDRYPPKTTLGKAIRYALKQQSHLFLYFEHAYVDPDNNLCERAMRRIAMGRKNYLFAGCPVGGQSIAVWCTMIETCARHGVDAEQYLNWLFDRISECGFDVQRDASGLTPAHYANRLRGTTSDVDCVYKAA